jgi:hypothetical protein
MLSMVGFAVFTHANLLSLSLFAFASFLTPGEGYGENFPRFLLFPLSFFFDSGRECLWLPKDDNVSLEGVSAFDSVTHVFFPSLNSPVLIEVVKIPVELSPFVGPTKRNTSPQLQREETCRERGLLPEDCARERSKTEDGLIFRVKRLSLGLLDNFQGHLYAHLPLFRASKGKVFRASKGKVFSRHDFEFGRNVGSENDELSKDCVSRRKVCGIYTLSCKEDTNYASFVL